MVWWLYELWSCQSNPVCQNPYTFVLFLFSFCFLLFNAWQKLAWLISEDFFWTIISFPVFNDVCHFSFIFGAAQIILRQLQVQRTSKCWGKLEEEKVIFFGFNKPNRPYDNKLLVTLNKLAFRSLWNVNFILTSGKVHIKLTFWVG